MPDPGLLDGPPACCPVPGAPPPGAPAPERCPPLPAVAGPDPDDWPDDWPGDWPDDCGGGLVQPGADGDAGACPLEVPEPAGPAVPLCPPVLPAPPGLPELPGLLEELPDECGDDEGDEEGDWLPELPPPGDELELPLELDGEDGDEGMPEGIVGVDTEQATSDAAQAAGQSCRTIVNRCIFSSLGTRPAGGRGCNRCISWMPETGAGSTRTGR